MQLSALFSPFGPCLVTGCAAALVLTSTAFSQEDPNWEAYNDYRPGDLTDFNASDWDLRVTGDGGPLRDFATGDELDVEVFVESEGTPDDFGANSYFDEDTPAYNLFDGKVDTGNDGLPGLRSGSSSILLIISGLDPSKRYAFRGSVSRGGGYDDRWSFFRIDGTDAHVAAHVDGSNDQNLFTKDTFPDGDLEEDEVALNTGHNLAGSLIGWDNIEPGDDGEFTIEARQYSGTAPFGNPGAGPYGYGFNSIYLAEFESSGALRITGNPPPIQAIPAGQSATFTVEATSPEPITYQWQRAAPGSDNFVDIAAATSKTYVTPPLTVADNGAAYRCVLASDGSETISGISEVEVDGGIPVVDNVEGSFNFNSVYVTFSEPMKLDMLGNKANYEIPGLTINSVVVLNATTARLLTTSQPKAAQFTLKTSGIQDLAGNPVEAGNEVTFRTYALANGVTGLEIWRNIDNSGIAELLDNPRYPGAPDVEYSTTGIDSLLVFPDGPNNTYGGRFRAWLVPKESGDYEFFLRAEDNGQFSISSDMSFASLDDPARVPDLEAAGNLPFEVPSEPVTLEAGKKYAVQVVWKEDNGADRAQLAWRKEGDGTPVEELVPIPSEFFCYYGPNAPDDDNDGMSDIYERLYGLNTGANDAAGDLDGDGLTNRQEHALGSAANSDDTDGDGLKDGVETGTGIRVGPNDTGTSPISADTDGDGLSDGVETLTGVFVSATDTGTDPLKRDTDGDGARDGLEVIAGFDPNDPNSIPSILAGGGVFTTTHLWTDGDPAFADIFEAEDLLLDADSGGERITVDTEFIHFHDNADPPAFLDLSRPYPLWDEDNGGAGGFGDHNNFAIRSVGQINVTTGGLISFICNSDDGFVLRIDGNEIGQAGDRGRANTLMEVDLDAGIHDIEFIHYELGGGAGVSLYIYRGIGIAPDLNEEEWELLRAFGGGLVPFEITDVARAGGSVTLTWASSPGESFIIEQGGDLLEWEEVTDGHPSEGASTSYTVDLAAPAPAQLYFRVRRE